MGAAYLAHRDDQAYEKRVAVKLIKRGMDTDAILRRFRHERQILARLDHPNIVMLVDGGTTPTGCRTSSWSTSTARRSTSTAPGAICR